MVERLGRAAIDLVLSSVVLFHRANYCKQRCIDTPNAMIAQEMERSQTLLRDLEANSGEHARGSESTPVESLLEQRERYGRRHGSTERQKASARSSSSLVS
eukprot:481372-Amphidinium_carterae.2